MTKRRKDRPKDPEAAKIDEAVELEEDKLDNVVGGYETITTNYTFELDTAFKFNPETILKSTDDLSVKIS